MKIINVFKTHFDIGFTDLSKNIVSAYGKKMLHEVLDACEKTCDRPIGKRFVWTMASWPLLKSLENASKSDFDRAQKFIKNGQLVIHALPYTLHTESLVSFGESSIFKFNGGKYNKPKENTFVFNLFNNQWGTNFPQWIEGSFIFDYIINMD